MNENRLEGMIETSLENLKKIVDVNTVGGEAIKTESGVTVVPISTLPLSGFRVPATMCSKVDLPAPLRPTMPMRSSRVRR